MEKPGVCVPLWLILFVQVALWTAPNAAGLGLTEVNPGGNCTAADQCVANATCDDSSGTCQCDTDFYQDGQECLARKAPGSNCSSTSECVDNAVCPSGTCQCDTGFYQDGQQCSARKAPGFSCSTGQCVDNAECSNASSGVCQCNSGYYQNGQQCLPRKAPGDSCSTGQCVVRANCSSGTCRCESGYYQDGQQCLPRKAPGDSCSSGQCVVRASCSSGVCQCNSGYYQYGQQCLPRKPPGFSCSTGQCVDNAECSNASSGVCQCESDYSQDGQQCLRQPPVGAIVGAVLAVLIIAIVVVVVVVMYRRKSSSLRRDVPQEPIGGHFTSVPVRKPIKLKDFATHLERLHKDSNLLFQEEYEDLQNRSPSKYTQEAALLDANKGKNRYINILPYDHTRVKLSTDDFNSDFINANYISGYTSPREYIATQGPMTGTFSDFWRMVWEQKSSLIVMLSDLHEKGKPMVGVDIYWPGELNFPIQYDDIVVEMTTSSTLNKYTIRTFNIHREDCEKDMRCVTQYFIPGWESAKLSPDDALDLIRFIQHESRFSQGPIVAHCSAGVGCTGTFIALDFLMQFVQEHTPDDEIDIFNLVVDMRHNRPLMVQSVKQYIFIHDTLAVIIDRKIRAMSDHTHMEVSPEHIYINQGFEPREHFYENTDL